MLCCFAGVALLVPRGLPPNACTLRGILRPKRGPPNYSNPQSLVQLRHTAEDDARAEQSRRAERARRATTAPAKILFHVVLNVRSMVPEASSTVVMVDGGLTAHLIAKWALFMASRLLEIPHRLTNINGGSVTASHVGTVRLKAYEIEG
eukprot:350172-Chlamydomonas_euryale.AAC.3